MNLIEAIEKLKSNGYKVINEETNEKEYIDELRKAVLKKAEEENFTVDPERLEAVMFEAFDSDMDLDTAKEKVWLAVYVDKNSEPEEIE